MKSTAKASFLLLFFAVGLLAWAIYAASSTPRLEGAYLITSFGIDGMVIEAKGGEPVVTIPYLCGGKVRIERRGKGYAFFSTGGRFHNAFKPRQLNAEPAKQDAWLPEFEVVPSQTTPGDWDLVLTENFPQERGSEYLTASFLHRLDDPRAPQYLAGVFEFRQCTWDARDVISFGTRRPNIIVPPFPAAMLPLAAGLAADHPNDPAMQVLYLDALVASHDDERLAREFAKDEPLLANNLIYRIAFRRASDAHYAHQLDARGRNACTRLNALLEHNYGLETLLQGYREFQHDEGFANSNRTVLDNINGFPLNLQLMTKIQVELSIFSMLRDRGPEALECLAAHYRLGQLMQDNTDLLTRLNGSSVCDRARSGLDLFALNACQTPEELLACWQVLERLNAGEPAVPNLHQLAWLESYTIRIPDSRLAESRMANFYNPLNRLVVTSARFQVLRLATAARYRLLTQGNLPASGGELAPLLPAGPPQDPFSSALIGMRSISGGIVCYSVGPDRQDDGGTVTYDPSNGMTSGGDITLEVPRARKYPFPRGGVRARTKDELLAQFPNGLPPDPFADTRGKPLGVSEGFPVYVYSYGPDGDENARGIIHPQAAYDPTNGTSSTGDLFLQVPAR